MVLPFASSPHSYGGAGGSARASSETWTAARRIERLMAVPHRLQSLAHPADQGI